MSHPAKRFRLSESTIEMFSRPVVGNIAKDMAPVQVAFQALVQEQSQVYRDTAARSSNPPPAHTPSAHTPSTSSSSPSKRPAGESQTPGSKRRAVGDITPAWVAAQTVDTTPLGLQDWQNLLATQNHEDLNLHTQNKARKAVSARFTCYKPSLCFKRAYYVERIAASWSATRCITTTS